MKRLAIVLFALALPAIAAAPSNDQILAVVAMPLATAAVSDVRGIPHDEIRNLADTLNQAMVSPSQFVSIMRYAPIALTTHTPADPSFVEFVQAQLAQSVAGQALVVAIDRKLPEYGVGPQLESLPVPTPHVAASDPNFFPPEVQAHFAQPPATTAMQTPVGPLAGNPYVTAPGVGRPTELIQPMISSAPPNKSGEATATASQQQTTTATTTVQQKKGQ